jgi:SAM-dependent methyltransferase
MSLPSKCPLCKTSINDQTVVTSHVFGDVSSEKAFFKCQSCEVIYQYPTLTDDEENKFYASEFEKFMESRSGSVGGWHNAKRHIEANKKTFTRRFNYLKEHLSSNLPLKILDIGCSSGFMLYPLEELGYECFGVEPSGVFSDFVKEKGIKVYDSLQDAKNQGQKFDVIMHFFVLEHIKNPVKFLNDQLELLNPNGKLIFEIPSSSDPLFSVYNVPAFEKFYWSIAHPWYFNEKSLQFLLNKLDRPYEIFFDQRYDLSNHIFWARDGKPGGMGKFTQFIGQKIEEAYKKNLIEKKLCDTLIGVISKK